jgi:predicted transcriptional regulator
MAMTLRLTDEETEALREFARSAHQSMQDVAREAIRVYVSDRTARRNEILSRVVSEDAELLDLLAK